MLPYPHGFTHDLSLITGENLPELVNPPRTPRIVGWGSYEAVLQGSRVFLIRHNIDTGNFHTYPGQGISMKAREAITHGTQYSWDLKTRAVSTALLWRTDCDGDSVEGASGSILCLGQVTDPTAQAVLFQNFEGPLEHSHTMEDYRPMRDSDRKTRATFKGGFLLPAEIRKSDIRTADGPQGQQFNSVNQGNRELMDIGRRNVTA